MVAGIMYSSEIGCSIGTSFLTRTDSSSTLTRRDFLRWIGLATAAGLIVACSPDSTPTTALEVPTPDPGELSDQINNRKESMSLNIGYSQSVITPSLDRPVYLAGFGNDRRAVDVHDDLYARALSVSDGRTTLILCALDLIGFFRHDMLDVIKILDGSEAFKTSNMQVVIASTHTHHGPDTMGLWGPGRFTSGVDLVYLKEIKNKIATTILDSLEAMKPAQLKATSVHVPGVAKNARDAEIVDDELTVVQFYDPHGSPGINPGTSCSAGADFAATIATLVNFPCHPEVLWDSNPHITSDYPGVLRREIESSTGAPCIFFAGALGGMMTPDVKEHSFEDAERMGTILAKAAQKSISSEGDCCSMLQVPTADDRAQPTLSLKKQIIQPKLTNILYKLAFFLKILPDVRDRKKRVETEVNLIKLGEAWFATVPGEMLPKLGIQIKLDILTAGAKVAGVIGLANDELGYILPIEDFKYPKNPFNPADHYEETNSISSEIGPKVMEALRNLL